MIVILTATLMGVVAGLRTMTAPAAVSWAAHIDWIDLSGSPLEFMGEAWTPYVFTALALIELVVDQLPSTPSRTVPLQFGARLLSGALCGAAIGAAGDALTLGAVAGVVGAVAGTLGGASAREKLAAALGQDLPAALIEDVIAVLTAVVVVRNL